MLMILTQVLVLLSTSIFLAANYKGGFIVSQHQRFC
jgi:hypothetical protein